MCATTDRFITDTPDTNDHFPNDDFFPDVDNLFDDMAGEDVDPKSSAHVAAAILYVFFLFLSEALPQFLVLVFALDMFGYSSYMQMLFTFSLSDRMTCYTSATLVMLYLAFLLIKSYGKLLIFSTIQKLYYRQFTPSGFAASMRPPMFEGIYYKR